jgi:hypothetical protein
MRALIFHIVQDNYFEMCMARWFYDYLFFNVPSNTIGLETFITLENALLDISYTGTIAKELQEIVLQMWMENVLALLKNY